MSILQINGADMPAPSSLQVTVSDQDLNSDTDANGNLHRNRITIKRKVSCEWGPLNWADTSKLLIAIKDVFFDVTYPDPQTGKFETKRMYVGDRTVPCLILNDDESIAWGNLSADFVEK